MKFQLINFFLLISLIFLLFFRYFSTRPVYQNGDLVKITATVLSEPIIYETGQYLKLKGLSFYLPKYPEVTYGDKLQVTGQVNNRKLENPKLIKIIENNNLLYDLREKIIVFYKSSLPEPYSSLVSGVVLGSKQMPQKFWDVLKKTGTAHVVVASGTNVTMFSGFMIAFLTIFFKRKIAIFLSFFSLFFYVFMSGFDAPIIRAAIMGSIVLFGQSIGRVTSTIRILLYSGALMLIVKPDFISDLGFILSFVATLSLILFQKRIDEKLKRLPQVIREGLSTSLAAQIGVAPIIFATFGQFNLLSPIINALILWTIPIIMGVGMIAGIVGLIVPVIGRLILFIIFPLLWYFVNILYIF